jgi:diguanylate cyclase (GGDEF)-like protein
VKSRSNKKNATTRDNTPDKPTAAKTGKSAKASARAGAQFVLSGNAQVSASTNANDLLDLLSKEAASGKVSSLAQELRAARLFNLGFSEDPNEFIHSMEDALKELTGCEKSAVLILDEASGTYRCLNDEARTQTLSAPRELTWVSDHFLQELLGSEGVLYTYLCDNTQIFGIVAIADKSDKEALTLGDQLILEQLSPYLAIQVKHYLRLRKSLMIPAVQRILLDVSNRLLGAVDTPAIFQNALDAILSELPFDAGQYIQLEPHTGKGRVLYQMTHEEFLFGKVIRKVDQFNALMSLFRSQVWQHPYLHLKGESLGDKAFSEMFGLDGIQSVLVLPMVDTHLGQDEIPGALVLFQQGEARPLSEITVNVLEELGHLIESATARAQVLEKALEIATTDELTGTLNRRGFYTHCHAEIDRANRNGRPMTLAILDLDNFKSLNDTYGHMVGDMVLRHVADILKHNLRKSDILCRFGGEEFTLVFPETSLETSYELIERLRGLVDESIVETPEGAIHVTFSAGVETVRIEDVAKRRSPLEVISEALARADKALYEAKHTGRNRVIRASLD